VPNKLRRFADRQLRRVRIGRTAAKKQVDSLLQTAEESLEDTRADAKEIASAIRPILQTTMENMIVASNILERSESIFSEDYEQMKRVYFLTAFFAQLFSIADGLSYVVLGFTDEAHLSLIGHVLIASWNFANIVSRESVQQTLGANRFFEPLVHDNVQDSLNEDVHDDNNAEHDNFTFSS